MTQDVLSFSESFVAALLSWILISTRSIPSFDGSVVIEPLLIVTGVVHVRSHWRRLPSGPETGPPRRESRVPGFLEWFHGGAGDPGKIPQWPGLEWKRVLASVQRRPLGFKRSRRDVLPRLRRRRWPAPTLLLKPGFVNRIPTLLRTSSRRSSLPRALWKARAPECRCVLPT
jgi:hypothetical protein